MLLQSATNVLVKSNGIGTVVRLELCMAMIMCIAQAVLQCVATYLHKGWTRIVSIACKTCKTRVGRGGKTEKLHKTSSIIRQWE